MQAYKWYSQLKKPSWAPPSWLFGPVWTILYILIFISFSKVFLLAFRSHELTAPGIPFIVALPFILNLIFNFAFTPLQFKLRNNLLAAIDVLLVFFTLLWAMLAIYSYAPWIFYFQIPYLLWVTFATILQLNVAWLNR